VEIKIGVQHSPRELTVESPASAEEIESVVHAALAGDTAVLTLVDERGRKVMVASAKLNYVEIGEPETRRVGFGAL
jgi:Protein of unknown function (DUF3107)